MKAHDHLTHQTTQQSQVDHPDATLPRTSPAAQEHVQPAAGRPIHWASTTEDLQQELQLLKNRPWLNEELITNAQKHWHCSRLQAIQYLLRGLDECSA